MISAGSKVAVWFSCGAASAVAAKLTLDLYGDACQVKVVNNPVKEEHEDNQRFLSDVEAWLGIRIDRATNRNFPSCSAADVWDHERFMGSTHGASCTRILKKGARQQWEADNKPDWHVLGFTVDEKHRHARFVEFERSNLIPVLIDAGLSKADCYRHLRKAGIKPSVMYDLGYPNANCIGCIKATSPTYWNHVRIVHPDVFDARAAQSRKLGVRLVRVKGERIFLDQLDPKALGRPMKGLDFECGIFCEEPA